MSLPPGFASRTATARDVARATEVIRAFEEGFLESAETTEADLADEWRELDLAQDVWLVDDSGGACVAYAGVYRDGDARAIADGYVVPAARGRGLGRYLVESTEIRARDLGLREIHNGVLEQDTAAHALLGSLGYTAARRFARMLIDLQDPPLPAPLPAGVAIRGFRPGADDQAFHETVNEAFAEHWGHLPEPFERWRELTMGSPRFDPTLWLVAEEHGEMVGVARCTWKVNDIGWVNDLGVHPRARKRGLALGLLTRAFAEFYSRGERQIGLGVDTANETGATRLYERAGMHAVESALIFEKQIA